MEILHLDYRPGTAGWVLPLQTKLQQSSSAVLRERYARWQAIGLAELGMAVATRFALTLRVAYRLGELMRRLRDEVEASGRIDELLSGGYAFTPSDSRILYDICAAVDAFYFEYRSSYEVVGRFVVTFGREILTKRVTEQDLLKVLKENNVNTQWIEPVRENRKLFFHNTAPWIALDVQRRKPLTCSLLIMKENIQEFNDPEQYVSQPQLVEAVEGFQSAMWAVRGWLEDEIRRVEGRAS